MARRSRRMITGILNLDKPPGWTSHDVVTRVRELTGERRVGHAGTLDPLATGVLVICVGAAVRLTEYLQGHDKRYRARIRLGISTDTYDRQGEVMQVRPVPDLTEATIMAELRRFEGEILQRPPVYSALKQKGIPLYRRARRGEPIQPAPRRVHIHRIELIAWQPPELTLEVDCSAGTYIRSLAHDLGEALGCGGHLMALVRLASGPFNLESAHSIAPLATVALSIADGSARFHSSTCHRGGAGAPATRV
jgi:tRNA pseudouridine55 synthase